MDKQPDSESCGMFGKIPQQADFISHHLPTEFTEYWHGWLQSSLSVSKEQLGDTWLDYYLTSPVWRFAIMPNIITSQAISGVLMPSVDEVGRYFPLSIAHIGNHQVWAANLHGEEWYQSLENVALHALNENVPYSDFVGHFEALEPARFEAMPKYQALSSVHSNNRNQAIMKPENCSANNLALSLLANAYKRLLGNHSLWWTEGSEQVDPCLIISADLPDAGQFAAMLDGDWQKWGWSQELILSDTEN
ncbi:type VI secretion system-associated protein TagF [Aurantivibrio infirmus]